MTHSYSGGEGIVIYKEVHPYDVSYVASVGQPPMASVAEIAVLGRKVYPVDSESAEFNDAIVEKAVSIMDNPPDADTIRERTGVDYADFNRAANRKKVGLE